MKITSKKTCPDNRTEISIGTKSYQAVEKPKIPAQKSFMRKKIH